MPAERYDLKSMHYGVDPPAFFQDAFNRISDELQPNQEATIVVNPEHMTQSVQQIAHLAENSGLSVVSTSETATDEATIEVRKRAA